jgi:hypothetical protein
VSHTRDPSLREGADPFLSVCFNGILAPAQSPPPSSLLHNSSLLDCSSAAFSAPDRYGVSFNCNKSPHAGATNNLTGKKKKRVRISEENPFAKTAESSSNAGRAGTAPVALTDQERSDSWWSAKDFVTVKDEVKRQCKDHRQNQRYSDCLTDAYRSACLVAAAATTPTTTRATACSSPARVAADEAGCGWAALSNSGAPLVFMDEVRRATIQKDLSRRLASSILRVFLLDVLCLRVFLFVIQTMARHLTDERAPRGLEVYSSRLHALRRQRHLQESKHAVFLEQARQQSHNQRDADRIAFLARRASRWARSFAVLLGRADAHWAAANNNNDVNYSSTPCSASSSPAGADCSSSLTEMEDTSALLAKHSSTEELAKLTRREK